MDKLESFRKQIDEIDGSIINLLAKRMKVVKDVGKYKKQRKIPPLDLARWQKVVETRKALAQKLGLKSQLIEVIWEIIHKEALKIEKKINKIL